MWATDAHERHQRWMSAPNLTSAGGPGKRAGFQGHTVQHSNTGLNVGCTGTMAPWSHRSRSKVQAGTGRARVNTFQRACACVSPLHSSLNCPADSTALQLIMPRCCTRPVPYLIHQSITNSNRTIPFPTGCGSSTLLGLQTPHLPEAFFAKLEYELVLLALCSSILNQLRALVLIPLIIICNLCDGLLQSFLRLRRLVERDKFCWPGYTQFSR